jgi:GPI mannosyltransferase 3
LSPIALFYGGNSWHYYLTQAVPILLTSYLPLFLYGVFWCFSERPRPREAPILHNLLGLVTWTVSIYSLAGHKEWRFIHPILPIMHIFCTLSVSVFPLNATPISSVTGIFTSKLAGFLVTLSLPVILYTTFIHGRAQIAVIHHLRSIPVQDLSSVGFLMPCHSTPWMAYLHRPHLVNGYAWSLGCEPPLRWACQKAAEVFVKLLYRVTNSSQYLDQTTAFYFSPVEYLQDYFPPSVHGSFPASPRPASDPRSSDLLPVRTNTRYAKSGFFFVDDWEYSWPQHLVMFGVLPKVASRDKSSTVGSFLTKKGYSRTWRTFNGFEEDEKRKGGVEVWSWKGHRSP